MKTYHRVIPRDLFNESKLLKCLGQLALLLHEGKGSKWKLSLEYMDGEEEGEPFQIELSDDGYLYCENLFLVTDANNADGESCIDLMTPYNCKSPYPLIFKGWDGTDAYALDDQGNLHPEFVEWLNIHALPITLESSK